MWDDHVVSMHKVGLCLFFLYSGFNMSLILLQVDTWMITLSHSPLRLYEAESIGYTD